MNETFVNKTSFSWEWKMAKRHRTDTRPTIAQIAAAAGVSLPTVSKVLNGRMDVSPMTRERIEQIIEEYGFVRNRAARALRPMGCAVARYPRPHAPDCWPFS